MFAYILEPVTPIGSPGTIDEYDRNEVALACLDQGQRFKGLVMGSEAAGKNNDRVGFFQETDLAGEEVFEMDELGVILDDLVRF